MKYLLFIFHCLVLFSSGTAQTVLYNVHKDTTLNKTGNPYLLNSNIIIDSGKTLSIQPGVKVYGSKNKQIIVKGTLLVQGLRTDSIHFTVDHSDPDLNNFEGISMVSNASAKFSFVHASYAKHFLNFSDSSTADISNSVFDYNKVGITTGKRNKIAISSSLFQSNTAGIDSVFISSINSCTFNRNLFGIKYSNGSLIKDCVFSSNSEKGLSGLYGNVAGNTFSHNNIGLEYSLGQNLIIYSSTMVTNNRLENNIIGLKIIGELPTVAIQNNLFCNNSLFSVYNGTSYSPDLTKNCWCGNDSSQVRAGIYDLFSDVSRKAGVVNFIPFLNNCTDFLTRYSISGRSVSSSALHAIWLYRSNQGKYSLHDKFIGTSSFTFSNLEQGEYKILSIGLNSDSSVNQIFTPTFFFKKLTLASAHTILADGDIFDIDIPLLPSQSSFPSSLSSFRMETGPDDEFLVTLEAVNGSTQSIFCKGGQTFHLPIENQRSTITILNKNGEASSVITDLKGERRYILSIENNRVKVNLVTESSNSKGFEEFIVYPSRAENNIEIYVQDFQAGTYIKIYNNSGQLISEFQPSQNNTLIDVSKFPQGLYSTLLVSNGSKFVRHFVKD
ncbi:MAG: T9SS type A sorting domain-containing protein [Opitutaceae bacterium]|nr:T9SS type A sorting domain-containing protein [Cytophagales bacterium]